MCPRQLDQIANQHNNRHLTNSGHEDGRFVLDIRGEILLAELGQHMLETQKGSRFIGKP
jgi:hypothetical protein